MRVARGRARRKTAIQIRFEILEFLRYAGPTPRTHLWRRATTLAYDDFLKHLNHLMERGLVEEDENGCRLTPKGRKVYDELKDSLPAIF